VQGIDGNSLRVVATGSMLIQDNEGRELMLTDVMLVPDMNVNVISVSKLTSLGLSCIFQGDSFRVESEAGSVLYDTVVNGVFTSSSVIRSFYSGKQSTNKPAHQQSVKCFAVSFERWNQRLGHASTHVLQQLVAQDDVLGLGEISWSDLPRPCMPCLKAK
jgi:hypothetical protein